MEVQTFLNEETRNLIYNGEDLEKWHQMINDLGIEGQATLSFDSDKSPVPFYHLNKVFNEVFETLCERSVDYKKFSVTPIPLEVLDLIALSEKEKYFQEIRIRWADKDPDPVVIGITGYWEEYKYYNDSNKELDGIKFDTEEQAIEAGAKHVNMVASNKYLLARWGDEKQPLETLRKMACDKWIRKETVQQNKTIREAKRAIEDIESNAFGKFGI